MNYNKLYNKVIFRCSKLPLSIVVHFNITLIVLISLAITFSSCVRKELNPNFSIHSNLEELSKNGKDFIANNDSNYVFSSASQRTTLHSRSGNYSVFSTPKKAFVLAINFTNIYRDSYIDATVWKKGKNAHLVCVLEGTKQYFTTDKTITTDADGWEKLNLKFYVPPVNDYYKLKFYVWNSGSDTVYCDDISLNIQKTKTFPAYTLPALHLEMDTASMISLMNTRKLAFKNGILQSSDGDWVKGLVINNNKIIKAKLRLKGDWLDHLHGRKWSYRIKLKKGETWNRMKVFSIQNPMARLGVSEWYLHKLMMSEELLTTRYGFIPLTLNGESMGLYAWEEHFAKQLVESQDRREGPIFRFDENALWDSRVLNKDGKMNEKKTPVFDVAVIKPFSTSKTIKDTTLFNEFLIAQNLMMQYKKRMQKASSIFDVKKLAKYIALTDVFLARHGMIWHNQRFYYNPVLCKLEPIAYDCYSDIGVESKIKNPITGFLQGDLTQPDEFIMVRELFNDTIFANYYAKYIEQFSKVHYLDSIFNHYSEQIHYYDSLIKCEYSERTYYEKEILANAKNIRQKLPDYKKQLVSMRRANSIWKNTTLVRDDYDTVLPAFFAPNLVIVYQEKVIGDSILLKVKNYYTEKIVVMGVGKSDKKIHEIVFPIPVLQTSRHGKPTITSFKVSKNKNDFMFFTIPDLDESFTVEINHWPEPDGAASPLQQLINLYPFPDTALIDKVVGKQIFIKNKNIILNHTIIIPQGYTVNFKSGTKIDLTNKAAFICNSRVLMQGTTQKPITITSSDFTGNGFSVLQAKGKSILNNVIFENLNTLSYNGWSLSGAVTCYEIEVSISNTTFYRNQCEDALNLVRCKFNISNSNFDNIYSDAFDSDFSNGEVSNTTFTNIGNDAMDFSGSKIAVVGAVVTGAKDKGISGGEDSKITVRNTKIEKSNIGIASKDLSMVDVSNSIVKDCNYGIVLLQKKPEYGPSVIKLTNTQLVNSKVEMLIEKNSKVIVNDGVIMGTKKDVLKLFY